MQNHIEQISEAFKGYASANEVDITFPLRSLFLTLNKTIPSEWTTRFIKKKAVEKFISEHKENVLSTHYKKNGKDVLNCVLYLGGEESLYVNFKDRYMDEDGEESENKNSKFVVYLLFKNKTARVDEIIKNFIKSIDDKKEKGLLNILVKDDYGFSLEQQNINCPDIDFDLNYNPDFKNIHDLISERLSVDKSKGLVLLHGIAGTGKTNYIRYLIHKLKKRVIYIPPNMTNVISDPELIKFFISYSNSILVIEDAENVLMKRSANSTQAISNILNLTDGLLSDCTNIQVVATFNMDILKIDEALMRKGRLIAKYEFKELEPEITEKLSKKIGSNIKGKHTLADIYNSKEESFNEIKEKIGF